FIDLFRATGQTKRALALSGIGAKTLGAFGPYYKYEAVALLFSEYPVLLDQNQPRLVIKFLQEASKEWDAVELDDQIHSYYRTSGLIALAVNCALTQSPDCSRDEALPELESYLNHVLNDYKGGEIGFMARDAATALALSAAVNHRTVPDVATTIIRLPPPSAETTDGAD